MIYIKTYFIIREVHKLSFDREKLLLGTPGTGYL